MKKYCIVENMFFGGDVVVEKHLTKEEVIRLNEIKYGGYSGDPYINYFIKEEDSNGKPTGHYTYPK